MTGIRLVILFLWNYNLYSCLYQIKKQRTLKYVFAFLVGLPGFEPGKSGPESEVLPLHHSPIISGAKIENICIFKAI